MDRTLALLPAETRTVHAHLSAVDVASMIDGRLPADRRSIVESHLAVCPECRSELAAAAALVDSAPVRPTFPVRWIAGAAAAVLALTALPLARIQKPTVSPANERAANSGASTLLAVSPESGAAMTVDSVRFVWRASAGVTTYQLFVTDSAGVPVYGVRTVDTTVTPAQDIQLAPGARYYWYVDALNGDGSSITSLHVGFSTRAR